MLFRSEETLEQVASFFKPFVSSYDLRTIGLGSFGPIDLLWFFLAAGTAFKLGSGQQEGD